LKIIAKYLVLLIFLISFQLNSQRNEIGLLFGGSNYIGDVGPTTYIDPFHMVLTAMVFYTEIIFQIDFPLEHKFQALI